MSAAANARAIADLVEGLNVGWLVICGAMVFLMQGGFALIEGGAVRSKCVVSVLLKNFVDSALGAIIFYLFGYAFAFGADPESPNAFIGTARFALNGAPTTEYVMWFFQFAFSATASTIVSGAVAERVPFSRYFISAVMLIAWVYPIICHAAWSTEGWISPFNDGSKTNKVGPPNRGVYDFAGSGVIHLTGGTAAIIASKIVGPRTGRFNEKGEPQQWKGHNIMMSVIGTIMLLFSWYAFNAGSTLQLTNGAGKVAARAVMTTTIANAAAALTAILTRFITSKFKHWDIEVALNASLAGAVANTAGCAVNEPWGAFVTGMLGAWTYLAASHLLLTYAKIDDPVDAGAVHAACGLLGVICPGLFASPDAIKETYGIDDKTYAGAFMGGSGIQLGYQVLFATFVVCWTAFWVAILFLAMKFTLGVRVSEEDEEIGLDEASHGTVGYDYLEAIGEIRKLQMQVDLLHEKISSITGQEIRLAPVHLMGAGGGNETNDTTEVAAGDNNNNTTTANGDEQEMETKA